MEKSTVYVDINGGDDQLSEDRCLAVDDFQSSEVIVKAVEDSRTGMELLKESPSALVTAGNTRHVATGVLRVFYHDLFKIKDSTNRFHPLVPPIALVVPNQQGGNLVLCDAGAQSEVGPIDLYRNVIAGVYMAKIRLGIERPRVGLLSIGEEWEKLRDVERQVVGLLNSHTEASSLFSLVGPVEPKDIIAGQADVVASSGREGNLILKSVEAGATMIMTALQGALRACSASSEADLAKSANIYKQAVRPFHQAHFAGGLVAGLDWPILICHGRSRAEDISAAISNAAQYLRDGLAPRLATAIRNDLTIHQSQWLPE